MNVAYSLTLNLENKNKVFFDQQGFVNYVFSIDSQVLPNYASAKLPADPTRFYTNITEVQVVTKEYDSRYNSKYIRNAKDINLVKSLFDTKAISSVSALPNNTNSILSLDDNAILSLFKKKTFFISENRKYLLIDDSPLWRKNYGDLQPISGDKVVMNYSLEVVDECTEKGIVRVDALQ